MSGVGGVRRGGGGGERGSRGGGDPASEHGSPSGLRFHGTEPPAAPADTPCGVIRPCRDDERAAILAIVNAAAEVYRGVIPADRWHEPYMPAAELEGEIAAGVEFWGYEDGRRAGRGHGHPAGAGRRADPPRLRRAGAARGAGSAARCWRAGGAQLAASCWSGPGRPPTWAIRFYERHGFVVGARAQAELLRRYWTIPERQIETSVVLAKPPLPG